MAGIGDLIRGSGPVDTRVTPREPEPTREVVNDPKTKLREMAEFAIGLPSTVAQQGVDMLRTGVNAGTFGALDELAGVMGGIGNVLTNEPFKEGFEEGRARSQGGAAAAEERLPLVQQLIAEVVGTSTKRTPVGAFAAAVEKGLGTGVKKAGTLEKIKRGLKDLVTQAGIGGAEGLVRGTLDNIETGKTVVENATSLGYGDALEGAGGGALGHAVLGMMVPKLAKYGIGMGLLSNRATANQAVGKGLLDTGPDVGGGVDPEEIRAQYPEMIANDTNLLMTGAGDANGAEVTNRIADLVAQTEFPEKDFAQDFDTKANSYAQTMSHINQFVTETNDAIKRNFVNVLGNPRESTAARGRNLSPQLRKYQSDFDSLMGTEAGMLGAKPVGYRSIVDSLDASIAKDMKLGAIPDMGSAEGEVYSTMIKELRPKGQYKHARDLHRLAHKDIVDGVDLDTAETKLNALMNARQALSETYRVGQMKEGTAINPKQARAAAIMIKNLDKEIAARTSGKSDDARSNFAKWMRVQDAEEAGAAFYSGSLSEHPDYGTSMQEFLDVNSDDADVVNAFKEGYKRQLAKDIESKPPYAVMRALLGDVSSRTPLDDMDIDAAGLNNLRTVLGDDVADNLIREFTDASERKVAQEKLRGYLQGKKRSPAAIEDLIRAQDDLLIATGVNPAMGATMFATSTLGAIGRRINSFGVDEAEVLMDLTKNTGRKGVETTEEILRTLAKPERASMGAAGSVVLTADTPDSEKDPTPRLQREITDYLSAN